MTQRYYRFAGVELCICGSKDQLYTEERRLAPFRVERVENPHRVTLEVRESLDAPVGEQVHSRPDLCVYAPDGALIRYVDTKQGDWQQAVLRCAHIGRTHQVQVRASAISERISARLVLNALEAPRLVAQENGFLLHASYVLWNGKAILFTAPSGTGKTTQAQLWNAHRDAQIVNGDRAAVRIENGKAVACGIPFAGSSQYCRNVTAPLAAIVYLEQAPQNRITPLRGFKAFRSVWEGCSLSRWDAGQVHLVSETVEKVLQQVPVYRLDCTKDQGAISALEEVL